jgi:hypothetical protein
MKTTIAVPFICFCTAIVFCENYVFATIVATGNSTDTFGDSKAFSVNNGEPVRVSQLRFSFTAASQGAWDTNLPGQPASAFFVDASSSSTGPTHSYADPSPARADFAAFRTLILDFTNFDPGETLVFGADSDGSIGVPLTQFGANNTGAFANILDVSVLMADGRTANGFFQAVQNNLIRVTLSPVPEPGCLVLVLIVLFGMTSVRRR